MSRGGEAFSLPESGSSVLDQVELLAGADREPSSLEAEVGPFDPSQPQDILVERNGPAHIADGQADVMDDSRIGRDGRDCRLPCHFISSLRPRLHAAAAAAVPSRVPGDPVAREGGRWSRWRRRPRPRWTSTSQFETMLRRCEGV
jgi:hypothetical protein